MSWRRPPRKPRMVPPPAREGGGVDVAPAAQVYRTRRSMLRTRGESPRTLPGEFGRMYETHFGLRQRPFPAAPDGSRYYPATGHEQALAQLQQALADGEPLALLLGEPGCGK